MSIKIKSLIVSLILILSFAGIGVGLYCAWPAITGTINKTKYYTGKDVQDAYDKGVEDAFKNKEELQTQVDYYKNLTDTYYVSIVDYQSQIKDFEAQNKLNESKITDLENTKKSLQEQVENLSSINSNNETSITSLNANIIELNNTVIRLNAIVSQNSSNVSILNVKIANLEKSISYYEQLLNVYQDETKAIARFDYNDSVMNIQVLAKGSKVDFKHPTDTNYMEFKGWKVDGVLVDLATFVLNENTVFVADIIYKFDVKFIVNSSEHDVQIILKGEHASEPEVPQKAGFVFLGWSQDGIMISVLNRVAINQATTFYAMFSSSKYSVVFKNNEQILETQNVDNGLFAQEPSFSSEEFKGWSCDGENIIDVTTYQITKNTIFTAIFGTYNLIENELIRAGGNAETNNVTFLVNGLKAGDKIKLTILNLTVKDGRVFSGGGFNSFYGYTHVGKDGDFRENPAWCEGESSSSGDIYAGEINMSTNSPFVSTVGNVSWSELNEIKIVIKCEKDDVLTMEWTDNAQFYIFNVSIYQIMVLR